MNITFEKNTIEMTWNGPSQNDLLDADLMKRARIGLLILPALLEHG